MKDAIVIEENITNDNIDNQNKLLYKFIKRVFDILVGMIGLISLLPVFVCVKIAYMITGDFHRIIFVQKRIGKNGKEFNLYKIRTMIPNADEELEKILKSNSRLRAEYKKNKKLDNDPRTTKVGKFVRKTSMDELPQLINILKSDMSLIGNRPYLPREKKDMGDYYDDIVKTKPGLTGYWQSSLRSRGTFQERLKMEKYYSNHMSLKFDIKILFKTVAVVLRCDGAK